MKMFLAYLGLVGIPVLVVAGVLRAGEGLTAPASVKGEWLLQFDSRTLEPGGCVPSFARQSKPSLMITQSGTHLLLRLGDEQKTVAAGVLEGAVLSSREVLVGLDVHRGNPACTVSPARLALHAMLDRDSVPHRLRGEITNLDCQSCAAIPFQATRSLGQTGAALGVPGA